MDKLQELKVKAQHKAEQIDSLPVGSKRRHRVYREWLRIEAELKKLRNETREKRNRG
jgi:hypothetical protein